MMTAMTIYKKTKKTKMVGSVGEAMTQVGSAIAGVMVVYAMFLNYFPYELRGPLKRISHKLFTWFYPYIQITFPEFSGTSFERNNAYAGIERYLNSTSTRQARHLLANTVRDSESDIVLTMAEHEEVTDYFRGIKLWWSSYQAQINRQTISLYPREDEKREFRLTFHRRHRDLVTSDYIRHVLEEGKAITIKERRRKLYTNNKSESWHGYRRSMWSHVVFEHPSTFKTLAMDPDRKQEIIDDLLTFTKSKNYYDKIGKAWKRGYLLYGPPGTGKSTMIAAMANFLKYDIYDLELTAVKDNTELRKMLINTASKSIVVIEDIDCSLDLTGQRKKKKQGTDSDDAQKKDKDEADAVKSSMKKMEDENKASQVTLSGLLNFIDGLWSACGGERIIVFTTNYVEKLDPALIRRGRMDKHIELSYCSFEAFKILANNYLDVDSHQLFPRVKQLLEETDMTPADVAENLMPKSASEDEETCLMRLIQALEEAKLEAARVKAEEEERKKQKDKEEAEKLTKVVEKENGVKEDSQVTAAAENGVHAGADDDATAENGVMKEN